MNEQNIELKDLCGEHLLTGVDRRSDKMAHPYLDGQFEDCDVLNFTLDGKTYTAMEDPGDGYRSSMEYLKVSDHPTTNVFAPVRVIGKMKPDEDWEKNYVLQLFDFETGKLVLEVGTDNHDDYYPCWVASFTPENMACNRQ